MPRFSRFSRYTLGVLAYTLVVILWGAFVRATGSGAGCGSHWPRCNGQIIPRPESIETMIEFSHRVSSSLLGLLMIGLVIGAFRVLPRGHGARWTAASALFFTIVEGLIGGAQVRLELVAGNTSPQRAIWQSAHLANTFVLVGAITLTFWYSWSGQRLRLRGQGRIGALLGVGLVSLVLLGISGAITALGDTLFPVESLQAGLAQDFSPTAHFLVRLRVFHPLIAVSVGAYLVGVAWFIVSRRPAPHIKRLAIAMSGLYALQLAAGSLNVVLLAPTWLQLFHLLLADLVWIALVLLSAATLAEAYAPSATQTQPQLLPQQSA